ncbi:PH domain-containing protein [Corynebacterium caspium]|uniref:PH domain-containing protein n=1 Tax=Corynebacterium caspium TaxID=234828 RepID=UPI0003806637|nr:PH domain-containing protein [Corynebacterium caspium]WKD59417.1 Low molecular weight protein antigen 6 [Corynebacterium caspium DSM 44850]
MRSAAEPDSVANSEAITLRPDRAHLIVAVVMTAIMLIPIANAPLVLGWFLIIPLLFIWWITHSATVIDADTITARYAFRKPRTVAWEEISGVGFKGSTTFVRTNSGEEFNLPAVSFNSLPTLATASKGRIPDALTQGREAADEKVRVIHRDGRQILITPEDYAAKDAAKNPTSPKKE